MKPQINDISVVSNEGTINPIIYRVPSGLSFKLLSQTMAGHSPCQVFQRDSNRARGQTGLWWRTLWDSPPMTYPLQRGSLGTLPGPRSSALEGLFAPKAEQEATVGQREGTGLEAENWGFRSQRCHVSFCDPGNSPDPASLDVGGQTGTSVSGGERAVLSPSPTMAVSILDVGEAAGPSSRAAAACLSPWQPGQKTNLPGSRLRSLPWSWVLVCLSGNQSIATPCL